MDINLPAGKYIVAVSGGVDSVVLLHLLAQKQNEEQRKQTVEQDSPLSLIVAHFDHGIREDSAEDRRLVQQLAGQYGLPFAYHEGKLGPDTSEAQARQARYAFLHEVRRSNRADGVITAHHQDDVLETIILNLLRGTGRRGLSSLKSTDVVKRPLLHVPKKELLRYAKREGLAWREDSTNADTRYLRNYIRHRILPRFADADREALLAINKRTATLNEVITKELLEYLQLQPGARQLDRHKFGALPPNVAREVMAEWLLTRTDAELSKQLLERLVGAAKTGRNGSKVDVNRGHWLKISRDLLTLE